MWQSIRRGDLGVLLRMNEVRDLAFADFYTAVGTSDFAFPFFPCLLNFINTYLIPTYLP